MSEAIVEKRRGQRLLVNREFKSIEEFITEYVTNLSTVGAFIRTDDPLPVHTLVDLKFTVIVDDFESIEGIGEVVRVVPPGGSEPSGMAVVFTELTGYSKTLIERLLVRQRADEQR
ncbi:MAG: PilZ domain-containing protein [Deltaproteobacteria bacterium]|nr:PilZ domain-containing protein [Deltaproteobacteria bacterium]